ncbi:MAG: imidazole glycerol phosphate synthase subunit HisH [Rhodopseudomonas palustris]|nr:imidazole glycerol phosphate synthase subunit HisH [Rhodopseudomonas palustris]
MEAADKIVLPGVGAFGKAVRSLESKSLLGPLAEAAADGRPFLGICLGMQLLYEESEEDLDPRPRRHPGKVVRFAPGRKIPHLGWNTVSWRDASPLRAGVPDGSFFYFAHSFYGAPEDAGRVSGETEYGVPFASAVRRGRLFGIQFHSGKIAGVGPRASCLISRACRMGNGGSYPPSTCWAEGSSA